MHLFQALKTITAELPAEGKTAIKACEKLTPRLLSQLSNVRYKFRDETWQSLQLSLQPQSSPETLIETLMTLSILITRFPSLISTVPLETPPLSVITPLLAHSRPAVRKRAISTLAQFVPISNPEIFDQLLRKEIISGVVESTTPDKQQTMVQLVAAVVRTSPAPIAPALKQIIPGILKAVERDNDDIRENALQTLEVLVLRCPVEVTPFLSRIVDAGNRFIKYDPVRNDQLSLLGLLLTS
jgi:cullin-associated NEDD8-dissociated protein 1